MLEIQTPDLHVLLLLEIHHIKVKHMKPFVNKALKSIPLSRLRRDFHKFNWMDFYIR